MYGVHETAPLENGADYHKARRANHGGSWDWKTPGLRVTRLRLLSDPGLPFWDVSYCHGTLNGRNVDVLLPFHQLPKRGMRRKIVEYAKADGVYAHGIGILENISTLI